MLQVRLREALLSFHDAPAVVEAGVARCDDVDFSKQVLATSAM